jgi:hypothetical protein
VLRHGVHRQPGQGFYALDVGLGFASGSSSRSGPGVSGRFYALDVGLGFASLLWVNPGGCDGCCSVSMPSMSGWALQAGWQTQLQVPWEVSFYALDVGLGFARQGLHGRRHPDGLRQFLCPRCRAGLCKRCPLEGLLTCAFVACCAKLPEKPAKTASIGGPPFRQAPDQPLSPRRPGRKTQRTGTSVPALKRWQSLAPVTLRPSARLRRSRASSERRFRRTRRTGPACRESAAPPRARSSPAGALPSR